jgi:hypothetical protein
MSDTNAEAGNGMGTNDTLDELVTLTLTRSQMFIMYSGLKAAGRTALLNAMQTGDPVCMNMASALTELIEQYHDLVYSMTDAEADQMIERMNKPV